jgi:hypothetical protein
MLHRLVTATLNLTIVGMICVATVGALLAGTWGLLKICNGAATAGCVALVASLAPAVAAYHMALNRNDLADR